MTELPMLDEDYRAAFLYLTYEMAAVKKCSEKKQPWQPQNSEKFAQAMETYNQWHPQPDKNFISNFPWPKPGQVPKVPQGVFKPSPGDKEAIRAFIERYEPVADDDPTTSMIVELAKAVIEEVH